MSSRRKPATKAVVENRQYVHPPLDFSFKTIQEFPGKIMQLISCQWHHKSLFFRFVEGEAPTAGSAVEGGLWHGGWAQCWQLSRFNRCWEISFHSIESQQQYPGCLGWFHVIHFQAVWGSNIKARVDWLLFQRSENYRWGNKTYKVSC